MVTSSKYDYFISIFSSVCLSQLRNMRATVRYISKISHHRSLPPGAIVCLMLHH